MTYRFDPITPEQLWVMRLSPGQRIKVMLDAREFAVGLIHGRLRRKYPDLLPRELNLKVLEEIDRVERISPITEVARTEADWRFLSLLLPHTPSPDVAAKCILNLPGPQSSTRRWWCPPTVA